MLYTHEHADHIFGLDDLRLMQFYLGGPVPLYCEPARRAADSQVVRLRLSIGRAAAHAAPFRSWRFDTIGLEPFDVLGAEVTPLRLEHGPTVPVLGFRFGNVAYCTDTNGIPPESMELLAGLDVLVLDCLRREPHATHFGLDQALAVVERAAAAADAAHAHVARPGARRDQRRAAAGVELAYDGLEVPLT